MWFLFLMVEYISVCFFRDTNTSCPQDAIMQIQFNDDQSISRLSKKNYHNYLFYFIDSMDVSNPSNSPLNSIVFSEDSNVNIIGCQKVRNIALESLFELWPSMKLTIENVNIYTKHDTLYANSISIAKSTIFPTPGTEFVISASILDFDIISTVNIYKWETLMLRINMDGMPMNQELTLYLGSIESNIVADLVGIGSNLVFGLKSHYIEMGFPDYNTTVRLIPQFCKANFNLRFQNQHSTISFTNFLLSKSLSDSTFQFDHLPNLDIIIPEGYWNLAVFQNFTFKTNNNIKVKSLTKYLPLSFNAFHNLVMLDMMPGTNVYMPSITSSTLMANSDADISFVSMAAENSTVLSNIKNGYVNLESSEISETEFTGSPVKIGANNVIMTGIIKFENASFTNDTHITIHKEFSQFERPTRVIIDELENNGKNALLTLNDDELLSTYKNVVCAKDSSIGSKIVAFGKSGFETAEYKNEITKEDEYTCVSLKKDKSTPKITNICVVDSFEEVNKKCGGMDIVQKYNEINLESRNTIYALHVGEKLPGPIILPNCYTKSVEIYGDPRDLENLVVIDHKGAFSYIKLVSINVTFTDRKIVAKELFLHGVLSLDADYVATDHLSLEEKTKITFPIENVKHIIFSEYPLTDITTYNTSIVINGNEINITENQLIEFRNYKYQCCTFNFTGKATGNLKISNSDKNSRATIFVQYYDFKPIDFIWHGIICFPKDIHNLPIDFNLIETVWLCMSDTPSSFKDITIQNTLRPIISAEISFKNILILKEGSINEYEDGEIYTDNLIIKTNNKNAGHIRAKKVTIYPSTYTTLSLNPYEDNAPIDFHVKYSLSSVPYIELNIPKNQIGKVTLENVDEKIGTMYEENVIVDFICARSLNCSNWDVHFSDENTLFQYQCGKGTFNPSLQCLSISPKRENSDSWPGYAIPLIVVGSIIGSVALLFGAYIIIGKAKRSIEMAQLAEMSTLDNDLMVAF